MSADTSPEPSPDEVDVDAAAARAFSLVDPFSPLQPPDLDGEQGWVTAYPGVEEWVREVFAPTFVRRTTSSFRWCASWWLHTEAITRLEALWRTWEVLRRDAQTGMAIWVRDHADHHLPILCAATGTFAECEPAFHSPPSPPALPTTAPPPGWWEPAPAHGVVEPDDVEPGF